MVILVYCPTDFLFSIIPLLYYYINLKTSITFCLFSRDIYLSSGISLSNPIFSVSLSPSTLPDLFCGDFLGTFPTKGPVSSAFF